MPIFVSIPRPQEVKLLWYVQFYQDGACIVSTSNGNRENIYSPNKLLNVMNELQDCVSLPEHSVMSYLIKGIKFQAHLIVCTVFKPSGDCLGGLLIRKGG